MRLSLFCSWQERKTEKLQLIPTEESAMTSRRTFISHLAGGMAFTLLNTVPFDLFASRGITKLTILHTNDVHSRIDPFPMNDPKYPGLGGVARRAALINKIRKEEKNVILLDAGDIFQGTPYFNLYGGEPELKLMSTMGYDAATIGNHDFDNGIDGLARQMHHMNFPFVNVNYDFNDTPLEDKIISFKIIKKDGIKTGVFGLGIKLDGLVDSRLYGNTKYFDPILFAEKTSFKLKNDYHCDMIICLSHLGYKYSDKKISDEILAKETSNIDLIIGGHTHTFLDEPVRYRNRTGHEVLVAQTGWAGIRLGRIDYFFDIEKKKKESLGSTVKISENTIVV
jgi:5'-nucleotidase